MKRHILCCLGLVFFFGICTADEIEKLEERLARSRGGDRIEILALLANANRYRAPDKAVEYGTEALDLLDRFPNRSRELHVLVSLSQACLAKGDFNSALDYNNMSMLLANMGKDRAEIAKIHLIKGRIYRQHDEYKKAVEATDRGLEISREIDDRKNEAQALNSLGITFRRLGDYSRALDYFVRSLEIEIEIDNKSGIARTKQNIGIIHKKLGDYELALECYRQSMKIKKEIGLDKDVDNTLNNIGNVYKKQGKLEEALKCHIEALDIREKLGKMPMVCASKINIAVVYYELEEFEKALEFAESALQIAMELGSKSQVASSHQILSSILRNMGKMPEALEQAEKSLRIARKIESRELVKDALLELSDVYAAMGEFENAYDFFKLYNNMNNSLFDRSLYGKIARYQAALDKEQELALLKVENEKKDLKLQKEVILRNASLSFVALTLVLGSAAFVLYRMKKNALANLAAAHSELEKAMSDINVLSGLLPICSNCKKVRDDEGYWQQIEEFISRRSEATFSHGICPRCAKDLYPSQNPVPVN